MQAAIQKEDYERAGQIRDMIKQLEKESDSDAPPTDESA